MVDPDRIHVINTHSHNLYVLPLSKELFLGVFVAAYLRTCVDDKTRIHCATALMCDGCYMPSLGPAINGLFAVL